MPDVNNTKYATNLKFPLLLWFFGLTPFFEWSLVSIALLSLAAASFTLKCVIHTTGNVNFMQTITTLKTALAYLCYALRYLRMEN